MEVDTTPPPGSASASPGPSSSVAAPTSSAFAFLNRKRRRSSGEAGPAWSSEDVSEQGFSRGSTVMRDVERQSREQWRNQMLQFGDQYTSLKRRHLQIQSDSDWTSGSATPDTQTHHFASLGAAVSEDELAGMASADEWGQSSIPESSHQAVLRAQYEDGVDSDMHLLRLASNSPPSPSGSQTAQDDALSRSADASTLTTSFLPRQIRSNTTARQLPRRTSLSYAMQRDHSAPFQPSPLASRDNDASTLSEPQLGEIHAAASASTALATQSNYQANISRAPSLRRTQTSSVDTFPPRRYSTTQQQQVAMSSAMSEDGGGSSGEGSTKSFTGNMSSDDEGEAPRGRSNWRSKPSFSPGLSSSPNFPGGKQMLRYTMGYRADCELCRNRTPGHYGHVVHRS